MQLAQDRLSRKVDMMYLEAIANIYKVDYRTVLMWRIIGRV